MLTVSKRHDLYMVNGKQVCEELCLFTALVRELNLDLDRSWLPKLVHPYDHFWLP